VNLVVKCKRNDLVLFTGLEDRDRRLKEHCGFLCQEPQTHPKAQASRLKFFGEQIQYVDTDRYFGGTR
jgi:hypothetical protein